MAVKQVKVLREADKKGPDGKAASKGLAFVELGDHEHALCALRQLNNNPAPFGRCLQALYLHTYVLQIYIQEACICNLQWLSLSFRHRVPA